MNGTILFPFDVENTSPFAYYNAIEFARKNNHNLRVVSTYLPLDINKPFMDGNDED